MSAEGQHPRAQRLRVSALVVTVLVGVLVVAVVAFGIGRSKSASATSRVTPTTTVASMGCFSKGLPAGTTSQSFLAGGESGSYLLHVPQGDAPTSPVPLLVDLHGYGQSAIRQAALSGWNTFSDSHHFIVVTPQVSSTPLQWSLVVGGADVTFLKSLVQHVESTGCIDTTRVFFTGFSDGAVMTSVVACSLSTMVASVATISGMSLPANCRPTRPVPVIAFHGTADSYIPYAGGPLPKAAAALPAGNGSTLTVGEANPTLMLPSLPLIASSWASRNGCSPKPRMVQMGMWLTLLKYQCPKAAQVELYRINGGAHSWPGYEFTTAMTAYLGSSTPVTVDDVIWQFLASHPLR